MCKQPVQLDLYSIAAVYTTLLLTRHRNAVKPPALASLLFQAGACFGLSAAACRTGFLLAEGPGSPLWIVLGIAFSALLTSSGFVIQTRGLKDGNTVIVCTCAAVSSMVSGRRASPYPVFHVKGAYMPAYHIL